MNPHLGRFLARLRRNADRPWFPAALGSLAGIDLFVAFIPTDGILVSSVLVRPSRWILFFFAVSLGSTAGAILLAAGAHHFGEPFVTWLAGDSWKTGGWADLQSFLDAYGFWALAIMAFGPLPQQPAVALCGLAHMPLWQVGGAVLLGRGVKYGIFAALAIHAPKLLRRLWGVRTEVQEMEKAIREEEAEHPPPLRETSGR